MRLSIAALAACAATAQAFKDTSPFVLFSSSPYDSLPSPIPSCQATLLTENRLPSILRLLSTSQLQLAETLVKETKAHLESCSSEAYYIIHQPSLSAHDVNADSFPLLSRQLSSAIPTQRVVVSDVKGLDTGTFDSLAESARKCGGEKVRTLRLEGTVPVERGDRDEVLRNHGLCSSCLLVLFWNIELDWMHWI
jgi:hypothetical protein